MNTYKKEIDALKREMEGWEIVDFQPYEEGFKLRLAQPGKRKEMYVIATDLGIGLGWVRKEKVKKEHLPVAPSFLQVWDNFEEMVHEMMLHARDVKGTTYLPLENPKELRLGFRCEATGKEFWIGLSDLRKTEGFAMHEARCMRTPQDRAYLGTYLAGGWVPDDWIAERLWSET